MQMIVRMLQRAQEFMPALAPMSAVRVWTGFRAATPDKLPLIGPWPRDKSLFLATGHEGLGITTSLATAKLVADQITGAKPQIAIEPYLPSRALPANMRMSSEITIKVNGHPLSVPAGATVAVAMALAGQPVPHIGDRRTAGSLVWNRASASNAA